MRIGPPQLYTASGAYILGRAPQVSGGHRSRTYSSLGNPVELGATGTANCAGDLMFFSPTVARGGYKGLRSLRRESNPHRCEVETRHSVR